MICYHVLIVYSYRLLLWRKLEGTSANINVLLLQMGDSEMTGSSSDGPESESLSWIADQMDWEFESDETDPDVILKGPPDSSDAGIRLGQNEKDDINEAESAIRDAPAAEDLGVLPNDEMNPDGRIFVGGIWWNSSWVEDMDLYDDNENWGCDFDAVLEEAEEEPVEEEPEEEDPEEEDPEEEDPEEDPEEEPVGDDREESSSGSNITP